MMEPRDNEMEVRFYKGSISREPDDRFPLIWQPGEFYFAVTNWLKMHPRGRVEIVVSK